MTTNESLEKFQIELEKAKKKDIHIDIEPIIDISVNYLDITITNENGQLTQSRGDSVFLKNTFNRFIFVYIHLLTNVLIGFLSMYCQFFYFFCLHYHIGDHF
jgi:hypothetical protein